MLLPCARSFAQMLDSFTIYGFIGKWGKLLYGDQFDVKGVILIA